MTLDQIPSDGGRYRVTTESGSVYVFDMAERTVSRTPGEDSHPDFNDGTHPLRSIVQAQLGASGLWTLRPDTPELEATFDYLWQLTSPIADIEAIQDE
jgi:hypothetical protein